MAYDDGIDGAGYTIVSAYADRITFWLELRGRFGTMQDIT